MKTRSWSLCLTISTLMCCHEGNAQIHWVNASPTNATKKTQIAPYRVVAEGFAVKGAFTRQLVGDTPNNFVIALDGTTYVLEILPTARDGIGHISIVNTSNEVVHVKEPSGTVIPLTATLDVRSGITLREASGMKGLVIRAQGATMRLNESAPWVERFSTTGKLESWNALGHTIYRSRNDAELEFVIPEGISPATMAPPETGTPRGISLGSSRLKEVFLVPVPAKSK
jgi:hypothetical protein